MCVHFKAGSCLRGKKCKFSHDFEAVRKVAKINMYNDPREAKDDGIDKWDQSKLESVIATKTGEGRITNETQIVCKYFLDAIENYKYGWLWECPNGSSCKYKHCLPRGFVFKPKEKKEDAAIEDEKQTLVDDIEEERRNLDLTKATPVTIETFMKWKSERSKRKAEEVENRRKEAEKKTGGRGIGVLSGRELFEFDSSLFIDDDDAGDESMYEIHEETEEEQKFRIQQETDKEELEIKRRNLLDQQEQKVTDEAEDSDKNKDKDSNNTPEDKQDNKTDSKDNKSEEDKKGENQTKPKSKKKKKKNQKQPQTKDTEDSNNTEHNKTEKDSSKPDVPVDVSLFLDDEQLPTDD